MNLQQELAVLIPFKSGHDLNSLYKKALEIRLFVLIPFKSGHDLNATFAHAIEETGRLNPF